MKLKTLSGYDLSPTFTTTKQEELLVRELVAHSTSRSGSTEPKSGSSHSPDSIKVTADRSCALPA